MHPVLVIPEKPKAADRQAILAGIDGYNLSAGGPYNHEPVAVLIQDGNRTIGGLWSSCFYDWMFVELLFVPEHLRGRGFGTRLMRTAEETARRRGCVGVWLDSFGFQAPAFYQALGYEVFGTLPDHPRGTTRYFLRKMLAAEE